MQPEAVLQPTNISREAVLYPTAGGNRQATPNLRKKEGRPLVSTRPPWACVNSL